MPNGNWKSLAFLGAVALLAGIIFIYALNVLISLPLNGWMGLLPVAALLVLTRCRQPLHCLRHEF
jgi:hypothetical protein